MEEYMFDGKPHALNKDKGYILKKIYPESEGYDLKQECLNIYREYAAYLIANNEERVMDYLMRMFTHFLTFDEDVPDTSWTMKEPHQASVLSQYGTLGFTFKRADDDTLVTP